MTFNATPQAITPQTAASPELLAEDTEGDDDEVQATAQEPPATPPTTTQESVVGHKGKEVPTKAISVVKSEARAQERKRFLLAEYGTADPQEVERIKQQRSAELEEYKKLKQEQESQKLASMSEVDRLKQELENSKKVIEGLEAQIKELKSATKVAKQDRLIENVAAKHVDSEAIEFAKHRFSKHLQSIKQEQLKRVDERYINKWFATFAEQNKRFAKAAPPVVEEPEVEQETQPETPTPLKRQQTPPPRPPLPQQSQRGRVPPPRPPLAKAPVKPNPKPITSGSGADLYKGKTPRPGQPNSMNARELKEYLASKGLRQW